MSSGPAFMIIGDRRCGTTALYYWLTSHPRIFMNPVRSVSYFVDDCLKTKSWRDVKVSENKWWQTHSKEEYLSHFEGAENGKAIGEKSADLFFWAPAHERLKAYVPNCKFIVILRDPVARAWSHYWHEVGKGRETSSFEQALEAEEERSERSDYGKYHLSYKQRGYYDESIRRFGTVFPTEKLYVVIFEQLVRNPEHVLSGLFDFVGVEQTEDLALNREKQHQNWVMVKRPWVQGRVLEDLEAWYSRGVALATNKVVRRGDKFTVRDRRARVRRVLEAPFRTPAAQMNMNPDTKEYLKGHFRPHIEALEQYVGYEIPDWM